MDGVGLDQAAGTLLRSDVESGDRGGNQLSIRGNGCVEIGPEQAKEMSFVVGQVSLNAIEMAKRQDLVSLWLGKLQTTVWT